ncbi:MAG: TolC family protein [Cyanobacteriota bacterium]|nr:TolC family protein [Cyanobacteriota bacterium]
MSVFRNVLVVGAIGVVISNGGQGYTAPPPMHSQSNAPKDSILDPKEVKEKSIEVTETQGVKSDTDSLEDITQSRHQGSLLEKLNFNSDSPSLGTEVPSIRHSKVKNDKQLLQSKPNQEAISSFKKIENIYKNTGSLLTQLKSHRKGENISSSALPFKQNFNRSLAANKNQIFNVDSKNLAELEKSNSSLLDLLQSNSDNYEVGTEINPGNETEFQQSITLADRGAEKVDVESKNVAELEESNSRLLDLLESKSDNSHRAAEISPGNETEFQQSITLAGKGVEKVDVESKNFVELEKSNSRLLDLLESKSDNSHRAAEISPGNETEFQQSITLAGKGVEKVDVESKNFVELEKSNSSLLDLLESKSDNSHRATDFSPGNETEFQQSITLAGKGAEKVDVESKNFVELEKSNSSLLDLLESKSDNSHRATDVSPGNETEFQQSITLAGKGAEKVDVESKNFVELEKSNSSLLDLLESKSDNSHRATDFSPGNETEFQQSITLAGKGAEKVDVESKNVAELEESNSRLLDLLQSNYGNYHRAADVSPGNETELQQSITLAGKGAEKVDVESKNVAELEKSNSSLLDLLESKSDNSHRAAEISPGNETEFQQSITLAGKGAEKVDVESKNFVELEKSNSSLLDLLESKSGNSEVETEINPGNETEFQQSITLADRGAEKVDVESKNVAELEESNSRLLDLLQSNYGNSHRAADVSPGNETEFQQSITLAGKGAEKIDVESKNVAELEKSNSSLLDLLESKSDNSHRAADVSPGNETELQQSITLAGKGGEKLDVNSKNVAELEKSNSNLLDLLQSKPKVENPKIETAKFQTNLQPNQENQTNNPKTTSEINSIPGNSNRIMTSINRAPIMETINDLAQTETQALGLTNPLRLPSINNRNSATTIHNKPTFGNTSTQKKSAQITTSLNQTSNNNTVPNLARVENQKPSSRNGGSIIVQQTTENFPPPVPDGTLQTNPPPQIQPKPNPLNFPITPDEVQIEETIPITLEQAIDLARRNNSEIEIAQLEVERSRATMREAQAALWPSLTFDSTLQRTESASGDLQAKAQQRLAESSGSEFIDTDIQNFPTTTFVNEFRFDYDFGLGKARSARIGIAREQMHLRELELERVSEQLRFDVSDEYYDLQESDGRVRIGEAAVANARKSLEDAEALERAGVGTRFDVLQAQVTLSNEQQNLTNSLRDQRTAQRRLVERLNVSQLINLTAADPIEPAGSWPLSLDETIVSAFQNRAELEQQLVQRDLSDEQRKLALSAVRPSLNFFATYNVLALTTDNLSPFAARGWADGTTVGFSFRWNFFDGGAARAAARQSILDQDIAENRFEQVRNQVRREVEQAFFGLEASFENISTAELGVEQAREALRLARLRFQAGVGTQLEVIDAETDLTRAENNLLTAIIDYNRSLSELQRAVSNLPGGDLSDTP